MSDHHEADGLDELEQLLTELEARDHELVELPDGLWEDIAAEALGELPGGGTQSELSNNRDTDEPEVVVPEMFVYDPSAGAESKSVGNTSVGNTSVGNTESNVIGIDSKRFSARAMPRLAIAAAAVVVAGMVGIVLSQSSGESTILASAQLAYDAANFDELGATAEASVVLVRQDGETRIKIDDSQLPEPIGEAADLELWLIEPDEAGQPANLVSLGLIDPENPGDFAIPDGFDPAVFFVVDISVEPRDGVESHSGRSILRGPLTDT